MIKDKLSLVVFSCDKFSDLWDSQIQLLEENWPDRSIETYIVTDKERNRQYKNVEILSAGEGSEFTDRVKCVIDNIKTEYIFITLDDYFLIKRVNTQSIIELIEFMDENSVDYLRLYLRSKRSNKEQIKDHTGLHKIDTSFRYSVNLYPGIWRKEFLSKTVNERKNPWRYEVSLPRIARENNASCVMSRRNEYIFLDVVRKGKILTKANRYLKKHDLYHGNRPVHTHWYEIKEGIQTWISRLAPTWLLNLLRRILIRLGYHFYSEEE